MFIVVNIEATLRDRRCMSTKSNAKLQSTAEVEHSPLQHVCRKTSCARPRKDMEGIWTSHVEHAHQSGNEEAQKKDGEHLRQHAEHASITATPDLVDELTEPCAKPNWLSSCHLQAKGVHNSEANDLAMPLHHSLSVCTDAITLTVANVVAKSQVCANTVQVLTGLRLREGVRGLWHGSDERGCRA